MPRRLFRVYVDNDHDTHSNFIFMTLSDLLEAADVPGPRSRWLEELIILYIFGLRDF
jgi:hypothetical protein